MSTSPIASATFESLTSPDALEQLPRRLPAGARVLSVYLDTSPRRVAGQADRLAFLAFARTLRAGLDPTEQPAFAATLARAERYLTEHFVPHQPGLALFVTADDGPGYTVDLPTPPTEGIAWDAHPHLEPLAAILDDAERVAVVLFDKERTRLFTVWFGAVEDHQAFSDEVPGKQATGGWFGLAQARYARHHEDHVLRHAKRTIRALLATLRQRPFDRLLLAGPDEALALLRHQLPRPLHARLAGTLALELFASDAEVLAATRQVAERLERQAEVALVDDLIDGATTPHVALGFTPTLTALGEGRVHRLVLAETFAGQGGACPDCGRLVAGPGACPACGTATHSIADLGEAVLAQAHAQGARVEIARGEAAARLSLHHGLGAWTRY